MLAWNLLVRYTVTVVSLTDWRLARKLLRKSRRAFLRVFDSSFWLLKSVTERPEGEEWKGAEKRGSVECGRRIWWMMMYMWCVVDRC